MRYLLILLVLLPTSAQLLWHRAVSNHFIVFDDVGPVRLQKLTDRVEKFDFAARHRNKRTPPSRSDRIYRCNAEQGREGGSLPKVLCEPDRVRAKSPNRPSNMHDSLKITDAKTASYALMHLVVAIALAYALTADSGRALDIGIAEPLIRTFAFVPHDRYWARRSESGIFFVLTRSSGFGLQTGARPPVQLPVRQARSARCHPLLQTRPRPSHVEPLS